MNPYADVIQPFDFDVTDRPYGWVQWKGTDACIDLHCVCGHLGHFDGAFFYYYQCPACHARYALGVHVALIPLTDQQASDVLFQTDTVDV